MTRREILTLTETRKREPVTLYVVPHCPLCTEARAWLRASGVEFVERDVAQDFGALRAMYKLTRQNLVPVFELGNRALVRPTEAELREFLL
jgi:glutaredoxin